MWFTNRGLKGKLVAEMLFGIIVLSLLMAIKFTLSSRSMESQILSSHTLTQYLETSLEKDQSSEIISIAIGLGITTNKMDINFSSPSNDEILSLPFFKLLLPSFCITFSAGFKHNFYLAYDYNDTLFKLESNIEQFRKILDTSSRNKSCLRESQLTFHLVRCNYSGKPAWAQNDAMMAAYMDNNTYYYRVNDDTILASEDWAHKFIQTLASFNPPNVGVVGPQSRMYNKVSDRILTYDFVHRTHIDIFSYYYPPVFEGWHADRWINDVYLPTRMKKIDQVQVKHIETHGRRYERHKLDSNFVQTIVESEKKNHLYR